ncbi:hypothetical protein ACQ86G_19330 [Roseateles chitinivorans]|uniref:hypothetical protein n=1 Tax=Roseateles chitinivorans TaxID=2917965 RepID=UPI003D67FE51
MFDSSAIYIAAIGAFFIACGMFVTFSLSRAIGAPSTVGRLTLACVAAIVSSAALATLALISLAPASCSGEHCVVEEGEVSLRAGLS